VTSVDPLSGEGARSWKDVLWLGNEQLALKTKKMLPNKGRNSQTRRDKRAAFVTGASAKAAATAEPNEITWMRAEACCFVGPLQTHLSSPFNNINPP
jgi:hypothetical protein